MHVKRGGGIGFLGFTACAPVGKHAVDWLHVFTEAARGICHLTGKAYKWELARINLGRKYGGGGGGRRNT